jgi:hypothetical protein
LELLDLSAYNKADLYEKENYLPNKLNKELIKENSVKLPLLNFNTIKALIQSERD